MKMLALAAIAALATGTAYSADLSTISSEELCIQDAVNLTLARDRTEVGAELAKRGEACEPHAIYLQAANSRVQNILLVQKIELEQQQSARVAAQQRAAQSDHDEERRRRWRAISEALSRIGSQPNAAPQQTAPPKTTHCSPDGIGGMICTQY